MPPTGNILVCKTSPSSNTAKLVVAPPILTKATPNSFCLLDKTASELASTPKTKSSISTPVR